MYHQDDKICSENRQSKLTNGKDEGAHIAALALAEVCQRGDSPQVSQRPGRSSGRMFLSPVIKLYSAVSSQLSYTI